MQILQKWETAPYWLKGGFVGVLICIILFLFYISIYSWALNTLYPEGIIPHYSLLPPVITGHMYIAVAVYAFDASSQIVQIMIGLAAITVLSAIYFGIGSFIGVVIEIGKWFTPRRSKK